MQDNLIKYGVRLRRIENSDIEMIRLWRNDPKILKYMNYKEIITPEMQKNWFLSINNSNNFYYIIEIDNNKIGLANFKNVDYTASTMESGIFIYNDEYLGTIVPFQTSLCLYDFGFFELKIITCFAHILKTNSNAIKFNKAIGFELESEQENIESQLYKLTVDQYKLNRDILLKKLNKLIISD
jgi:UDP-4-amino-4,6-dideoxy-N-acetyl-beta-L-altrosamine N-acetyltransferase